MKRFCLLLVVATLFVSGLFAQEPVLTDKQRNLAANYSQLENILLRMAEIDAATNPKRSALLKKVLAESKERLMNMRFSEIIDILEKQRLTDAINEQTELTLDLKDLLRLLESENRAQRRDEEKERIAKLLKEINDLIHREKSLKGKTQQAEKTSPLESEQRNIHDDTDRLSDEMAETQAGPRSKPSESKSEDGNKSDENKSGENKPNENKSDENKSSENKPDENKSGENKPEQQKPDDNKSEEDEQVEADASQSPAQQAMQRGMQRMRRAQKRLEESKKKDAIDEQEEAIAELQKAKAELDKILRQLREEELMQTLQWLDARIKKMLAMEKLILTQTQKAAAEQTGQPDATNEAGQNRLHEIRTARIAADQATVILDADAALIVLREDGTAQAMTESLSQTRFDMVDVQERMGHGNVGTLTQEVEQTIIRSLEEMLDAIDAAKKESEKRQQQAESQQQNGGQMSEEDQRLINILSELRMIRQMQIRVNDRTQRYEKMATEPNANLPDLGKQVEELSRQQSRIAKILNTIKVGKNE